MTMGRPAKPVEVKRRQGNPGKRALPEPVTVLPGLQAGVVPRFPVGLASPGKRMWADLWRYTQAWMSTGMDLTSAELACRLFDEIAGHRKDIGRYGRLVEEPVLFEGHEACVGGEWDTETERWVGGTPVVTLKANPALASLRAAEKSLGEWLSKMGIPPADRARLGLAQVKAESKLDELMERRQRRAQGRSGGQGVAAADPDPGPS